MAYIKYLDSKKLMETIGYLRQDGKSNKEISTLLNTTPQRVSYYLKRLGFSRPKTPSRKGYRLCVVCRARPASPMYVHVCNDPDCVSVFHLTASCTDAVSIVDYSGRRARCDADMKIALDIQKRTSINIPVDAAVCVKDDVTRVFSSVADHIRYHAYHYFRSRGKNRPRPPAVLWVNEGELRLYKMRKRDADYARRNENSEHPQPLRVR